jgi:hypothetical protein
MGLNALSPGSPGSPASFVPLAPFAPFAPFHLGFRINEDGDVGMAARAGGDDLVSRAGAQFAAERTLHAGLEERREPRSP